MLYYMMDHVGRFILSMKYDSQLCDALIGRATRIRKHIAIQAFPARPS